MRRLLPITLIAFLLATVTLVAQYSRINSSGTLPSCVGTGGLYVKTGASQGFYFCMAGAWLGPLDVSSAGVFSFLDDVRQTFNPGANAAGLNVGSVAGDPGTLLNGDLWYDSAANELTARINGANVALGAGGGSGGTGYSFGWFWSGDDVAVGTHPFPRSMPVAGTITRVRLIADTACDAAIDLWLDDFAAYPPTNADSIVGTDEPELTADLTFEDTTFTNYSATTFAAGDLFLANIDSVSGCGTLFLQVDWEE